MSHRLVYRSLGFGAALLLALTTMVHAGTVYQGPTDTYLAFEAESYQSVTANVIGATTWVLVNTTTPIFSPAPVNLPVIPAGSNVSGGVALLADFGINSHDSTATYRVNFNSPGTYRFYVRYSMYQSGTPLTDYGQEDSFYRPPDFDQAPTAGDVNGVTGFSTTNVEGVYGWFNTSANYTVDASDVAAGYVEFKIDNRERGLSLDRLVFSTSTGLSGAQLDALANGRVMAGATHFNNLSGDSMWETPNNWNNGLPAPDVAAYIGGSLTANLTQAGQQAGILTIGHAETTLPGSGTLNQAGGSLTIRDGLTVASEISIGTYTATGGTLTVGQVATGRANLYVGLTATDAAGNSTGTLDLSGATQFNAYLNNFVLGQRTAGGTLDSNTTGTVKLAQNNTIDAVTILISDSAKNSLPQSTLTLGAQNNILADTITVGARKGIGRIDIAAGGSLTLGSAARRADLLIGRKSNDTGVTSNGTVDLSAGSTVTAYLDQLLVGTQSSGSAGAGGVTGTLKLAPSTSLDVNLIVLGDLDAGISTTTSASLTFGTGTTTITTPNFIVGRRKGTATATLPAGATLNLVGPGGTGADLRIGFSDTNTSAATTGTMSLNGGTFNATLDELVIGYHQSKTGGSATGTLSFNAGTVTANTVVLGDASTSADGDGTGRGTLNLAGTAQLTTGSMTLGTGTAASTGTLNVTGGAMTVMGGVTGGVGTGTLNVDSGAMTVANGLEVDSLRVGANGGTATLTVNGGPVAVGSPAGTSDFWVGYKTSSGVAVSTGTADFRNAASFGAVLDELGVGVARAGGTPDSPVQGTLLLSPSATIDANTIYVSDSTNPGLSGLTSTLTFGAGTSDVTAGTFIVGGRKGLGLVTVAAGGTLNLGTSSDRANLYIGRKTSDTGTISNGTVNLSAGSGATAYLNELLVGTQSSASAGSAGVTGTFVLAPNTSLDANLIVLGDLDAPITTATSASLTFGTGTTTITTPNFIVGRRKATATATLPAGATLNLVGPGGSGADLRVGFSDTNTNAATTGTMNLNGGTFNATLDELVIGYHQSKTAGSATGTVNFDTGAVTANTVVLGDASTSADGDGTGRGTLNLGGTARLDAGSVTLGTGTSTANGTINLSATATLNVAGDMTGGAGTSTVNLKGGTIQVAGSVVDGAGASSVNVDEGAMTVAGALAVDTLRVGLMDSNGGTATLTVSGGPVVIGSGTQDLMIGRRTIGLTNPPTPTLLGELNLANSSGVTVNVDEVLIGTIQGAPSGEGTVRGNLILAQPGTNAITANSILVGDSSDRGNTVMSTIQLGAGTNTINTNKLTLGGRKGQGTLTIAAGGTLTLEGKTPGTPVDVDLGVNVDNTGTTGIGVLNTTGGTLNAVLGAVRLGKQSGGGGSGSGTLAFDAGTVTANTITMATGNRSNGTVNMAGGTLAANSIAKGAGTANFNWTGGTLHVDNFGFNLLQRSTDGPSTLAPGRSVGMTTIAGNYTMQAGVPDNARSIEIEINGLDQGDQGDPTIPDAAGNLIGYDFVLVQGSAVLDGLLDVRLTDGFVPALGDYFDVIQTTGDLDISDLTLAGDEPGTNRWGMSVLDAPGGGFILRLESVPEPSTLALAALALAALLGCGWRRRYCQ